MKKQYRNPAMRIVRIQHASIICISDPIDSVEIHDEYSGGTQFTRESTDVWDEEW